MAAGKPYSWITETVLDNDILAYDNYSEIRTFLENNPNVEQIHEKYKEQLSELSLLNEDIRFTLHTLIVTVQDPK